MKKFYESRENMSNDAVINMVAATRSLNTVMVDPHSVTAARRKKSL